MLEEEKAPMGFTELEQRKEDEEGAFPTVSQCFQQEKVLVHVSLSIYHQSRRLQKIMFHVLMIWREFKPSSASSAWRIRQLRAFYGKWMEDEKARDERKAQMTYARRHWVHYR